METQRVELEYAIGPRRIVAIRIETTAGNTMAGGATRAEKVIANNIYHFEIIVIVKNG
jgi:hypothetical protein